MNKKWLRQHVRKYPFPVQQLFLNETLSSSERVLRSALRQNPESYPLHSHLAALLVRRGRRREALITWRQAVRRFPGTANPFFQRANWALERRDFVEAEKYLLLCLRRDRGYFRETAHFWRAEALLRLGRTREAREELAHVPDGFEERWFLDYESWTKEDLAAQLQAKEAENSP
jgi:tetratricopeptide (TPR) repeat protein